MTNTDGALPTALDELAVLGTDPGNRRHVAAVTVYLDASVADAAEKERDLSKREVAIRHILALLNEVAEHPGGAWR
jgi:hypothetical protein